MQVPIEQLLNLPDIQVLNVEITGPEIKCDIESTRGCSICHRCGQKATRFFEHGETLTMRHLQICEKDVYLYLRTKRYLCPDCNACPTTTERCEWYDADAKRAKAEEVCTDLYEGFINAAEEALPQAKVERANPRLAGAHRPPSRNLGLSRASY